uniref:Uncharacterized protein n=1 Tax=Gasterosteus aculeatus TaxID=69293 RepID=G3P3E0_GASAC
CVSRDDGPHQSETSTSAFLLDTAHTCVCVCVSNSWGWAVGITVLGGLASLIFRFSPSLSQNSKVSSSQTHFDSPFMQMAKSLVMKPASMVSMHTASSASAYTRSSA